MTYEQAKQLGREKLIELCRAQPEIFVDLFLSLIERVEELEARLGMNSRNSSKPPSSDGLTKAKLPNPRLPSHKKPGGQPGHKGNTLRRSATPHFRVIHAPTHCQNCGGDLSGIKSKQGKCRQVFDLPIIQIEVTEHQLDSKECPHCHTETVAEAPIGVEQPLQYGERIKALGVYLAAEQLLPFDRAMDTLGIMSGHRPNESTLFNDLKTCSDNLEAEIQTIKQELITDEIIHADETGVRCEKHTQWLHSCSTEKATYYELNESRGKEAMDEIGILPNFSGILIHDCWRSYFNYENQHGLCNAHISRELTYMHENLKLEWAWHLKLLLHSLNTAVRYAKTQGLKQLSEDDWNLFSQRYDTLVQQGLAPYPQKPAPIKGKRGRRKQDKAKNLLDRLLKYKESILLFANDFRVPFTNNQAERDIRMVKVKMKISGCFRSKQGAKYFFRIRSFISTMKKKKIDVWSGISMIFRGIRVLPINDTS